MCQVRFIGCLHLGHKWMAQHRGFNDEIHHDEHLIDMWNRTVGKKDLTYILGDVGMESDKQYHQLDKLKGRKIVILGNHCLPRHVRTMLKYVESVAGMVDYKGFILTHCPIHPMEIGSCRGNIHAHIHENKLIEYCANKLYHDDTSQIETLNKYYNVDAKLIDFKPKTIEELINESNTKI